MSDDAFLADLTALGYRLVQDRATGQQQYSLEVNRYLTYWVHWDTTDGVVLFTWELAIGAFMDDHGLQVGANEPLNSFLFPKHDARGGVDIAFVVAEMDRVEHILRSLDFIGGAAAEG